MSHNHVLRYFVDPERKRHWISMYRLEDGTFSIEETDDVELVPQYVDTLEKANNCFDDFLVSRFSCEFVQSIQTPGVYFVVHPKIGKLSPSIDQDKLDELDNKEFASW